MKTVQKPFRLLRWFSYVSLTVTASVAAGTAYLLSSFFVAESVQRDGLLTAQFIQAIADAEVRHAGFGPGVAIGEVLDYRLDAESVGPIAEAKALARREFYEHVRSLPDSLAVSLMAPDRVIIWSSNPVLVGLAVRDSDHLERALRTGSTVSEIYPASAARSSEQRFIREPVDSFIENYVPLKDRVGRVVAVVEVYKEPRELTAAIGRGYVLIWAASFLGGAVIYLSLFWVVRRAARVLKTQQDALVSSERLAVLGEMSGAVADAVRAPLAEIRSHAEVIAETSPVARVEVGHVLGAVDRLSSWGRELVLYSRPFAQERGRVELCSALAEALKSFSTRLEAEGVVVDWQPRGVQAWIMGNRVLLLQALHAVIENAIDAMPNGGRLRCLLTLQEHEGQLVLTIADSGPGMSADQLGRACEPFYSTKRDRLGIGLFNARRIVEEFGGEFSLSSLENVGTEVQFVFEAVDGAEPA